MVVARAVAVVDGDEDALIAIAKEGRDEAVVVGAVLADGGDDDGCRLMHVRLMVVDVLASCIHRLEVNSRCQAKKPTRPQRGCLLQAM